MKLKHLRSLILLKLQNNSKSGESDADEAKEIRENAKITVFENHPKRRI